MNVLEQFIKEKGIVSLQINSFDDFITHKIDNIIQSIGILKCNHVHIEIKSPTFQPPSITESNGDISLLNPKDAKLRNLSYLSNLYVDFEVKYEDKTDTFHQVNIGSIPIMIGSSLCNKDCDSCQYDTGGYFIISGSEKVIIAQEKMANNEFYIFEKKSKYSYEGEIRCLPENTVKSTTTFRIMLTHPNAEGKQFLRLSLPFMKQEIPAFLIFAYFDLDIRTKTKSLIDSFECSKYSLDEALEVSDVKEYFIKHSLYKDNPEYIKYQLEQYFLYHSCNKIELYKFMLYKICHYQENNLQENDRDHLKNKRVDMVGSLLSTLFRQLYKKFTKDIQTTVAKQNTNTRLNIPSLIKPKIITNGLKYALATGNWGINTSFRTGVSQVLNRHSYVSMLSHLRRINSPLGKEGKMITPRQLHGSHAFRICPCETPEGHSCGLVKNMALTNLISLECSSYSVRNICKQYISSALFDPMKTLVFVNGDFLGTTVQCYELIKEVRSFRRNLDINPEIGIGYDETENIIRITTDSGRSIRPLIIVTNGVLPVFDPNETWSDYIKQGKIEYIDSAEEENLLIAFDEEDMNKRKLHFTHCEIHASAMLGVVAGNIPFAEHNQAPRNVYQSAMAKQAMGMFATDHNDRMDTFSHILHYPQKPLVSTSLSHLLHYNEMPSGMNVVVAIMCYTGYNQEDSIIMSKSAVDRGLFRSTFYRTYKEEQNYSANVKETLEIPNKESCVAIKYSDYSKLDPDGIVKSGIKVNSDDIIVGKTLETVGVNKKKDASLSIRHNEDGHVDKVMVSTNEQGMTIIKTKIRSTRIPEIGDKFCSKAAQKGTIGMLYSQEDLPFTQSGITPDIIVNPHAIPSRMTIGQLIECIYGKVCALKGEFGDATAFVNPDPNQIGDALQSLGFQRHGEETMYHGHTGEMIPAKIFIGPTYYQRLKHMVADKIHARSRGPLQILTRQPVEGRSRDGGLRFGEMEKDSIVSHGASSFLKERLLDQSDAFITHVCSKCGLFAAYNFEKQTGYCKGCDNTEIYAVKIPYACKLLFQELQSMNIVPRFRMG